MTSSVAEEAGNDTSTGDNRTCSDGRSRENECDDVTSSIERRDCSKKPLYNGGR